MPTLLKNGVVTLSNAYTVCREGDVLDSNQTRLLKLFGLALANFHVTLLGYYDTETHDVVVQPKKVQDAAL